MCNAEVPLSLPQVNAKLIEDSWRRQCGADPADLFGSASNLNILLVSVCRVSNNRISAMRGLAKGQAGKYLILYVTQCSWSQLD